MTNEAKYPPGKGPQWSWTMPEEIRNKFSHLDRVVLVNSKTNIAVSGSPSESVVARDVSILNDHEFHYGRPSIYEARPIPAKLHNRNPFDWKMLLDEGQGEDVRKSRSEQIIKSWEKAYPLVKSPFLNLAFKAINHSRITLKTVDWASIHDQVLNQRIWMDVREPPYGLSELLHLSPGAVTREEQDLLCTRLDELINIHTQDKLSEKRDYMERQHG